jgi:oxygen-independent coproporphyrinogen-3 oxidase
VPEPYGLYLHIPFCATKCPYCDFYSGAFAADRIAGYVDAVAAEIERAAAEPEVAALLAAGPAESLFLGGGTPSHLPAGELARLLAALRRRLPLASDAELTAEANPESLDDEMAAALRDLGVNRVSVGVQSLDDAVLRRLGRPHDAAQALAAARRARIGFARVNFDLILAAPELGHSALAATLDRLLDLGPDHLSAYGLTIETGTAFAALKARGELRELPDDEYVAQDELTEERCQRAGLLRYEVSNYARPGEECRHNLAIWRGGHYLGLGPSAHSYLPAGDFGMRRANVADLAAYVARIRRGESPVVQSERLDRDTAIAEHLLLGLRLTEGVDLDAFERRFGISFEAATEGAAEPLLARGLLARAGRRLIATPQGRWVLDSILLSLTARLAAA